MLITKIHIERNWYFRLKPGICAVLMFYSTLDF